MEYKLIICMFIKQISFWKLGIWIVFIFHSDTKPHDTKSQVRTPKTKTDIEAWLNQLSNIHIFKRNPTSRRVDFKTTHQLDECTQNLHMHVHRLGAISRCAISMIPVNKSTIHNPFTVFKKMLSTSMFSTTGQQVVSSWQTSELKT
jgi:hypothetical protein